MSENQQGYDPADQAPAEGQSKPIPVDDKGKNPGVDPAAKEPAEGGREEAEQGERQSS